MIDLKDKLVLCLGERDGIAAPALQACVESAGAEVIYAETQCFVWTSAGAMDLEEQGNIARLVASGQHDRMVAMLGTPNPASTRMVAMTLRDGDPSYAGPLAGIPLGLPVYHILEDQVKESIDPDVYEYEVGPMEFVLDRDGIINALQFIREAKAA